MCYDEIVQYPSCLILEGKYITDSDHITGEITLIGLYDTMPVTDLVHMTNKADMRMVNSNTCIYVR